MFSFSFSFFLLINLIADIKGKNLDVIEQEDVYNLLRAIELLAHKIYGSRRREIKRKGSPRHVPMEMSC